MYYDGGFPERIKPCLDPHHEPPNMMVFPPEGYLHRCPSCGYEVMCYPTTVTC